MAPTAGGRKQGILKDPPTEEEDKFICKKCKVEVKDDEKALGCEVCEYWYHIKCENDPEEVYDFMSSAEQGKQLNWSCSFCHHGCSMLQKRIRKIEEKQLKMAEAQQEMEFTLSKLVVSVEENKEKSEGMEDRLGQLEVKSLQTSEAVEKCTTGINATMERLGTVKAKLESIMGTSATVMEKRAAESQNETIVKQGDVKQCRDQEEMYREICDMRSRENNIVIYGFPESNSEDTSRKIEHDRGIVKDLLVACNLESEQSKILWVSRLGRPRQDRSKPRPILVKLLDITVKRNIFGNIKLLQGNRVFENVRIKHDLTRRELQQESTLWNEAKKLNGRRKGETCSCWTTLEEENSEGKGTWKSNGPQRSGEVRGPKATGRKEHPVTLVPGRKSSEYVHNVNRNTLFMSSNVDVYSMDKRRELETRIKEMEVPPSIICLQEVNLRITGMKGLQQSIH